MTTAMGSLKGKTLFISGGSRGIGEAIAIRAARDGANVAIAAKTVDPHPKLPGTLHTAAANIERAGGKALALVCDIRVEEQLQAAVDKTAETFGGIDILINNASAISITGTLQTPTKMFDLIHDINLRGTFLAGKACLPHLLKAANPHILTLSPPLNLNPKYFGMSLAYTMGKFGMSLCTLGWADEFRDQGIAANSLWPHTTIATAAIRNRRGGEAVAACRTPEIMADAAHAILTSPARSFTGRFCIDELVLRERGISDFSAYAVEPGHALQLDLFLVDWMA